MKGNIVVVDYEIGNVRSIVNAFRQKDVYPQLSRQHDEFLRADGLVLPGVGAFAHGMDNLEQYGLVDIIRTYVAQGKPLIGICLGMQLLFEESEEFGLTKGLGLVDGQVVRLPVKDPDNEKLPHVSWNEIHRPEGGSWYGTIFDGLESENDMYFAHSFVVVPRNRKYILSTTTYSKYSFTSSIRKNNIYGCQFHPEKSASVGLKVIENFIRICENNDNI